MRKLNQRFLFFSLRSQFSQSGKLDYYQLLNLRKTASKEEIKVAFLKMAKIHHPDKSKDSDKFREILEAYKILSDEKSKRKYDNDQEGNFFSQNNKNNNDTTSNGQQRGSRRAYTFYQKKPTKKNNDFDYENSPLVEEGFLKTLQRGPELIVITIVMVLLIGRWLFLYYGFINYDLQRDKGSYYIDSKGVKRRKTFVKEKELKTMTMEQIDDLEKSGLYLLPLDYEEALENYRHNKYSRNPQNYGMFNYNKKNLGFNTEKLRDKQNENLKAQQNL